MKNLRIGIKTGICFGLILIMFAGLSYSSLLNLNRIKAKTSDVIKIKDNIGNIQRFSEHLIDAETGQRGFMITGKEEYLEPYHRAVNHLEIELVELSSLLSESSQQHKNYIELETMVKEKLQEMESTIDAFHQEGIEHAHEIVKAGQGKELMDRIRAVLDKVEREEEVQLEKKYAEMEWVENHARRIITWIGSVVLLFVILVTHYFTVTISRPTEYVARQVSLISKGDLRKPIKRVERRDEIGLMINSLAAMSEVLQQQLRDIRNGIDVLSSSSSEIMSGVAQLAASASETATAIGQTTTTIEEVKQTAEVSNRKSQEVSAESRKNARISDEGNKAIQETNESMQVIKQKMDMIATVVLSLNEQSHTIGEITATVNDLAEQSNILAVNAAIEAAKAGEQGKGFAVVASEIKNLATRSKEATSQVRMILNEVQKSISKVVMATEDGSKTVENGSELLKATREAIELLSQSVTLAAQASVQIASSSQQQLVGMDQIVAAMENIRDSSSQIAATTQQTSFSVNDLHRVGERLQEMINFYKVQA